MTLKAVFSIVLIVIAVAVGQILFKSTALAWQSEKNFLSLGVLSRLIPAAAVYGFATLAWIWMLQRVPLQMAYPFMALTFVLVPIGGYFFFGERINLIYCLGVVITVFGVIITVVSKQI